MNSTDFAHFDVPRLYVGLYSMSGMTVRLGFGFRSDPFGSS